jgi:hypothetical protein
MNRRGTRASYRKAQNLKAAQVRGEKSQPEKDFNDYQESRRMGLIWDKTLPFEAGDARIHFDFQCDFLRPTKTSFDIDFEIDGEAFHSSDREKNKDKWKDRIKNEQGLKVIHIAAELTRPKWWSYLDEKIPKALILVLTNGAVSIDA